MNDSDKVYIHQLQSHPIIYSKMRRSLNSRAFPVHFPLSAFVILLLRDPHLLEGSE